MAERDINNDPIYNTVDRDDFLSLIEVDRYADRADTFDSIISATVDHFWDPTDPRYIDFDQPFDMKNETILPREMIVETHCAVADKLDEGQMIRLSNESSRFMLSSILHGEQGALIVASQLVGAVPWIDAKYYAGTQTMDEARHVEVFSRYVHEKLEWEWPITDTLKELLDATITDSRWDFKYLGMQILIEGLAMAAFGSLYQMAQEPLIKELLKYVMKDESRHVAFGMLSLKGFYDEMSASELKDREDFIIYACELMRNRLVGDEIANAMGWNQQEVQDLVLESELGKAFRAMLFMRVVPNLKKLGLITPRVRAAFEQLEIIQFEDADPEAQDRALGFID